MLEGTLAPSGGGVSFLELFMQAHAVVQFVMLGLLLGAVW